MPYVEVVVAVEQQVSIFKRCAKQKQLAVGYNWVTLPQRGTRAQGVEQMKRKKEAGNGRQMEAEGVPALRRGWGV